MDATINPFVLETENLEKYLEATIQNPRAAKELIKLEQIPLYNLKFEINSINDDEAKKLIDKFGADNYQHLQERIEKFDKRWIALSRKCFEKYSSFDIGGKKNKLLFELSDLTKTYDIGIGLADLLKIEGEYNKDSLRSTPRTPRIEIPFKNGELCIKTIPNLIKLL